MGSGVIISRDGYIITNNHVIESASTIEVTTNNNKSYKAELIGKDEIADIAVLKIDSDETFPYIRFADSDQTKIGEWVLACLLYTSPSPRDVEESRMPSSA